MEQPAANNAPDAPAPEAAVESAVAAAPESAVAAAPESAVEAAVATARSRWDQEKQPDSFVTTVTAPIPTPDGGTTEQVRVHISHHETFPMGGRTFTVNVREMPDTRDQPGTLLHRERIHLSHDQLRENYPD